MLFRARIPRRKQIGLLASLLILLCVSFLPSARGGALRWSTEKTSENLTGDLAMRAGPHASAAGEYGTHARTAQNPDSPEIIGTPWVGEVGIEESVFEIMERERRSQSLRPKGAVEVKPELFVDRRNLPLDPDSPIVPRWPAQRESLESPALASAEQRVAQSVGASFLGAELAESNSIPPDSMGDVGPSQILVAVNGRIKVFDKQGVLGALNADLNTFFGSVRAGSSASDPRVRYDRLSGRWFVTAITVATPNRVLISASNSATISSTSTFTFFQFQHDLAGTIPNADTGLFADYDTLGVDTNALYMGVNVFNGSAFVSTTGFVIQKDSVLGSGSIVITAFRELATVSSDGPFAPQGVDNDDPASAEGYFVGVSTVSFGRLILRRVTNPGGAPAISGNIVLTVPSTAQPLDVLAKGSGRPLDALDDRLFQARIHNGSLWTAHNLQVDSTGIASSSGGRTGTRFYEITNLASSPILRQAGTLFDAALTNPRSFWIPSCAVSGQGHMALGSSVAGPDEFAEIAVAGRLASDPLGFLQAPAVAQPSTTSYNVGSSGTQRWGDYSVVSVDPNDDMTIWTFQEYCNATNSWGVRVIQLLAPPPATLATASPSNVSQGIASTNIVLTGTSTGGSGFFDPGAGFPNHISATVSGGVTVNAVTFTDPTHLTLNVSTVGATLGPVTVTITNPDGQSVTGSSVLTVTLTSSAACGDVNGDGVANSSDALLIRQVVVGLRLSTDPVFTNLSAGDVNGDGLVNATDALFIRQVVVGLRSSLPCRAAPANRFLRAVQATIRLELAGS